VKTRISEKEFEKKNLKIEESFAFAHNRRNEKNDMLSQFQWEIILFKRH
jgi:hypothetical protein